MPDYVSVYDHYRDRVLSCNPSERENLCQNWLAYDSKYWDDPLLDRTTVSMTSVFFWADRYRQQAIETFKHLSMGDKPLFYQYLLEFDVVFSKGCAALVDRNLPHNAWQARLKRLFFVVIDARMAACGFKFQYKTARVVLKRYNNLLGVLQLKIVQL